MKQKLFNVTVTFNDIGSATIKGLTQEQAWELQSVCQLIGECPPNYSTNGVLLYSVTAELVDKQMAKVFKGGFFARLLHRFNQVMAWLQPN